MREADSTVRGELVQAKKEAVRGGNFKKLNNVKIPEQQLKSWKNAAKVQKGARLVIFVSFLPTCAQVMKVKRIRGLLNDLCTENYLCGLMQLRKKTKQQCGLACITQIIM